MRGQEIGLSGAPRGLEKEGLNSSKALLSRLLGDHLDGEIIVRDIVTGILHLGGLNKPWTGRFVRVGCWKVIF